MASTKVQEQPRPTAILMNPNDLLRVALAGAAVGIVAIVLYWLIDAYVFTPALCQNSAVEASRCANKPVFTDALAMILAAIIGLFGMIQLRVYRPLLVVILTTLSIWSVLSILTPGLAWWGAMLGSALVFALTYALFAWLVQLRHFLLAVCVSLVVVVVIRLLLLPS